MQVKKNFGNRTTGRSSMACSTQRSVSTQKSVSNRFFAGTGSEFYLYQLECMYVSRESNHVQDMLADWIFVRDFGKVTTGVFGAKFCCIFCLKIGPNLADSGRTAYSLVLRFLDPFERCPRCLHCSKLLVLSKVCCNRTCLFLICRQGFGTTVNGDYDGR